MPDFIFEPNEYQIWIAKTKVGKQLLFFSILCSVFDADQHQRGGHKAPIICLSADLAITCSAMKQHPKAQISPHFIRGHPWSSEGTQEPGRNSQMEEIFVGKCQTAGTGMFLGTRQVWGPASEAQAKVPLEACLPARKAFARFTQWASRVCRSRASPSLGPLWRWSLWAPQLQGTKSQLQAVCPGTPHAPAPQALVGVRGLSILGKGKTGSSPVRFINPNAMLSLSKLPFQGKLCNVYSETEKGHSPKFPLNRSVILGVIVHRSLQQIPDLVLLGYDVCLLAQVRNFIKSK